MMTSSRRAMVVGLVLQSALQLIVLSGQSSAELSDPSVVASVNSTLARYHVQKQVSGAFQIQSSEALHPLLARLGAEFHSFQPKVTIDVKRGSSSKAIAEFLQPPLRKSGKILMIDDRVSSFQLVVSSHQLSESEVKEFVDQHGYEPTVVPLAVDAVAVYVHKDNPLPGLTLAQVDAMFSSTRKRESKSDISKWGQLGLADEWKEAPVQLYGRDKRSGARAVIHEHGLAGGEFKSGIHEAPGAASVILDVSHDPIGIGYSGIGLETSNVRAVPIAEKDGMFFVSPSFETVADQSYPLRRTLYLYLDQSPKEPLPDAVQEFLTFILSRKGEGTVMQAGLFPLPPAQAENRSVAFGVSAVRTPAMIP